MHAPCHACSPPHMPPCHAHPPTTHVPLPCTPLPRILRDAVNRRAVRILVECFIVTINVLTHLGQGSCGSNGKIEENRASQQALPSSLCIFKPSSHLTFFVPFLSPFKNDLMYIGGTVHTVLKDQRCRWQKRRKNSRSKCEQDLAHTLCSCSGSSFSVSLLTLMCSGRLCLQRLTSVLSSFQSHSARVTTTWTVFQTP